MTPIAIGGTSASSAPLREIAKFVKNKLAYERNKHIVGFAPLCVKIAWLRERRKFNHRDHKVKHRGPQSYIRQVGQTF